MYSNDVQVINIVPDGVLSESEANFLAGDKDGHMQTILDGLDSSSDMGDENNNSTSSCSSNSSPCRSHAPHTGTKQADKAGSKRKVDKALVFQRLKETWRTVIRIVREVSDETNVSEDELLVRLGLLSEKVHNTRAENSWNGFLMVHTKEHYACEYLFL